MGERDGSELDELRLELEAVRAENRRLRSLLGLDSSERVAAEPPSTPAWEPTLFPESPASRSPEAVDGHSLPEAKVTLFRSLFAGRDDVHAARWENERTGKSGWSPVVVGGPANARRPDRSYVPLDDGIIEAHLTGRVHVAEDAERHRGSRRRQPCPLRLCACRSDRGGPFQEPPVALGRCADRPRLARR